MLPPPFPSPPSPRSLNALLFPHHRTLRTRLFDFLKHPLFRYHPDLSIRQRRRLADDRLRLLHSSGLLRGSLTASTPNVPPPYYHIYILMPWFAPSLQVKLSCSLGLFFTAVSALGTADQRRYWLPRIESGRDFGCFALTELTHGSNVRAIQTRAEYLPHLRCFDIHTPSDSAQKYWIGAAAEAASHAVVFCQLFIRGVAYGVNAFIVRLRDDNAVVLPGILIADCGEKAGYNGVDNGRIWFTHVRIPLEDMLSSICQVAPDGTFTSPIASETARFTAMLAPLTEGRVGLLSSAVCHAMLGLTIAIRYSFNRCAFAPTPTSPEKPLLFYKSQQRLLMIPLATAIVYRLCALELQKLWINHSDSRNGKTVHILSAGYKALFSSFMQDALQASREACGGQGYKAENIIAPLKASADAILTFEGANAVLLQQVGKALLSENYSTARSHASGLSESTACLSDPLGLPFFREAFYRLEEKQVGALRQQYALALTRREGCAFDAWNDCSGAAERAARAYLARTLICSYESVLRGTSPQLANCRDALALCGLVWAVETMTREPEFLRLEVVCAMDASKTLARIDELCEKMTAISRELLGGIGVPEHLLPPITRDYVAHNSRARL